MNCRQMLQRLQMLRICGFAACVFGVNFAFAADSFAADCGGEGQRECTVWENFPSCKDGRIAFGGNCYTKNACGKENQRPCIIIERIPSCNPNLKESGGSCIHPDCGRKDQRTCVVTERIPSCDNDLIEYGGKCYGRMECGALNRRPCTIAERVPSCDGDLVEMTSGKCVSMNFKPLKLTIVNDCDKKMESILLYDQKDLMAKGHALNILAAHYWQTALDAGKQVTTPDSLSLPQNYENGSPWLYKIRVSGKCVVGGEAGVDKGGVSGKVSGEQLWTVPCDKGGKGKDYWYENIKHGSVVRICSEFKDAQPVE